MLSGGTLNTDDFKSNSSIIANVLNTDAMGYPLSIKPDAAQQYPQQGNTEDLYRMSELLRDARMEGDRSSSATAPCSESFSNASFASCFASTDSIAGLQLVTALEDRGYEA